MKVPLKRGHDQLDAEWQFASWADVGLLLGWRDFLRHDSTQNMHDAASFARQVVDRWRNYSDGSLAASSWDDAARKCREMPEQEFAALFVLKAAWWFEFRNAIAFAYVRRTWCAGLYLEFTAGHPAVEGFGVRGILTATLHCMARFGQATGSHWIWWEATRESFPRYQHIIDKIAGAGNALSTVEPCVKDVFLVRTTAFEGLLKPPPAAILKP